MILESQKIYIPNKFKFTVQTLGIFTNEDIIYKSCDYIIDCLNNITQFLSSQKKIEPYTEITYDNESKQEIYCNIFKQKKFYILELKRDDYTIGKLIEKYFYLIHSKKVEFVGFKKDHPTKKEAYIYIKYIKQDKKNDIAIIQDLIFVCKYMIEDIFSVIKKTKFI